MMNTRAHSLLDEVPLIRRAAGYRLYTGDGRRFLDAWQAGGAALLGHRAGRYREAFANKAQRGLTVPLPAPETRKLRRALATWLPADRPVRLFENNDRMFAAIRSCVGAFEVVDPAMGEAYSSPRTPDARRVVLARPFLSPEASAADWMLPVLPLPAPFACAVLLGEELEEPARQEGGSAGQDTAAAGAGGRDVRSPSATDQDAATPGPRREAQLPDGELVPVASIASVTRALHHLFRVARAGDHGGAGVAADLAETGVWRVRGPYLEASVAANEERYRRLFLLYRDKGVIISPDRLQPSIVPADMSKGERALLIAATERAREEGLTQ